MTRAHPTEPWRPGLAAERIDPGYTSLAEAILWRRPDLPDAQCRDRWPLFDAARWPQDAGGRGAHEQARTRAADVCRVCPHRAECTTPVEGDW